MVLYHGSLNRFKSFDLSYAKPFKDFGQGIYLTTNKKQALRRAAKKNIDGYLYICEIHEDIFCRESEFNILKLTTYNKEWLDYISTNRRILARDSYDIVYDRMADNTFPELNSVILKYYRNKISVEKALRLIMFPEKSNYDQYCFKTVKAVHQIRINKICRVMFHNGGYYEVKQ